IPLLRTTSQRAHLRPTVAGSRQLREPRVPLVGWLLALAVVATLQLSVDLLGRHAPGLGLGRGALARLGGRLRGAPREQSELGRRDSLPHCLASEPAAHRDAMRPPAVKRLLGAGGYFVFLGAEALNQPLESALRQRALHRPNRHADDLGQALAKRPAVLSRRDLTEHLGASERKAGLAGAVLHGARLGYIRPEVGGARGRPAPASRKSYSSVQRPPHGVSACLARAAYGRFLSLFARSALGAGRAT